MKLYAGELASATPDTILSGGTNSLARHARRRLGDRSVRRCGPDRIADLSAHKAAARTPRHRTRDPFAAGPRRAGGLPERDCRQDRRQARRAPCRPLLSMGTTGARYRRSRLAADDIRREGRRPDAWSPVQIADTRNGSGDLTITWVRRTRFGGVWADGVDVPLNEESERYEIDVMYGANVSSAGACMSRTSASPSSEPMAPGATGLSAPPMAARSGSWRLSRN